MTQADYLWNPAPVPSLPVRGSHQRLQAFGVLGLGGRLDIVGGQVVVGAVEHARAGPGLELLQRDSRFGVAGSAPQAGAQRVYRRGGR